MDMLTIIMLSQHQPRAALRYESTLTKPRILGNVWCPVCVVATRRTMREYEREREDWEWTPLYDIEAVCYCCGTVLENPRELV